MVDTVILWPSKSSFKTPAGTHEVDIPSNVTVYLLCARRYSEGTRVISPLGSPWPPLKSSIPPSGSGAILVILPAFVPVSHFPHPPR